MPKRHVGLIDLAHDAARRVELYCGDLIEGISSAAEGEWGPPTDVYECADQIVIKLEIAGLQPGDAEVIVERNIATIRGVRRDACPRCKLRVHRMQIPYGRFERRLKIDSPFDRDAVSYDYRNGFLEVIIPKTPPPEPRRVQVQA